MSEVPFMLKFRPFQTSPEWEFKDPDSGNLYTANTRADLVKRIVQYRAQNELPPIEHLDLVIENYLCQKPYNSGRCVGYATLARGLWATVKGGIAVVTSLMYKSFATQEEADRRSEICVKCPHNIFPDKSGFIFWADSIATASIGTRRSANHDKLGNCGICSCPLRAKVFFDGKIDLKPGEEESMKKVNCWQV